MAGKRFCRACGTALPDAALAGGGGRGADPDGPADPAAAGPVAQRRVCSVLFCDLVGFTPLSQSRDSEEVRELLSQYFAMARTVVSRYGGTVEKFIGDAVMAVWGTPVATEGDAERAVRAGLDLVAGVADLGAAAGIPGLAARAGIVTGEVAVTLGAVGEGMVAGDAVNTAARVQATAEPGQILVDAATQRLAGRAVDFREAGAHQLKGRTGQESLWRATRVLAGVGGAQRVDGLEAPLTGRDAELRTIRELFHAAAERRTPRLVLVAGPAGVGKSRLGWEFEKYIDGLAADVWWHRGRCLSYGEGVAFWALAGIVRQRLGIAEEDPAEVAAEKLAAGLDRFLPDPRERGYVGVRLGRLLGVNVAGDSGTTLGREELFAGWRLFIERLAASGPVVLLIEDAQYADTGLLDFLDHLVDWVRDLPVFLLVFTRPELGQGRPTLGAGRNRTTLTLDPLDSASMDALVDALVPGMPPAARAAVTGHAQGIPLFAVETIRALVDRDIVQPVGGVYRLTGDIGDLSVPDSLHALLAARLDALPPDSRRLAADAAVLGASFPAEALIAVSDQDEPAVRAGLAELLRREVLVVSADPLSPERGSYQFAQQMLRQVAYDTLSRRDRKTRHLAVAAHLRATFSGQGEEVTDVIARHFLDAIKALPDDPDTPQIRREAVTALIRAAERAERTGALARSATAYGTAAQLIHDHPDDQQPVEPGAGRLWEKATASATENSDWDVAVEYSDLAREDHLRHSDPRAAARAEVAAGNALRYRGHFAKAREKYNSALVVLRDNPDGDTVEALLALGGLEAYAGTPESDQLTSEALTLGQALGVGPRQLVGLFTHRGIFHGTEGRRPQAAAYFREAALLAARSGDTLSEGRALLNLSDSLTATDPVAGAEAARQSAERLRRAGSRNMLTFAIVNLFAACLMIGDWDEAARALRQAVDDDGLADVEMMSCLQSQLAGLQGDVDTADRIVSTLTDLPATDDPQDKTAVFLAVAFTAAARGQTAAALRQAREILGFVDALGISADIPRWAWPLAVRSAHELKDAAAVSELLDILDAQPPGYLAPMLQAERDLVRVRVAASGGDDVTASFSQVITVLREKSTPYHLAHGLLDQAEFLTGQGDADAAADAVGAAREIADRLHCRTLTDRAARIEARSSSARSPRSSPAQAAR
jgi:class 3 adenylate cyclase/tetratricopeptide (TPR) repeat protein